MSLHTRALSYWKLTTVHYRHLQIHKDEIKVGVYFGLGQSLHFRDAFEAISRSRDFTLQCFEKPNEDLKVDVVV